MLFSIGQWDQLVFLPTMTNIQPVLPPAQNLQNFLCSHHLRHIWSFAVTPFWVEGLDFWEPFMELVRFALESLDELLWHSWSQVLWTQLNAPFQVTSKMALLCGQEPKALWTGYHHHSQSWSLSKGKLAELWRNLIIWGTWPMRGKWSCTIQLS